jgi:hypothetical protein
LFELLHLLTEGRLFGAADIAFIEAPESRAELEEIPKRVKHPLFVNMLTGGVAPILSVTELEQLGYKIVVCPIESLMVRAGPCGSCLVGYHKTQRGRLARMCCQKVIAAAIIKRNNPLARRYSDENLAGLCEFFEGKALRKMIIGGPPKPRIFLVRAQRHEYEIYDSGT